MYRIWCERSVPAEFRSLLDGVEVIEPGEAPFSVHLDNVASADAVIATARVRYDGSFMDRAPHLRVISRTGIGLDNFVIADATARGIAVCYAPDAPTISTAEHTIALLMAVARDLKRIERLAREGGPIDFHTAYQGRELNGLRLGLVGLGRIGGRVATMARGIGMEVTAFDPLVAPERARELGVALSPTLDDLLAQSDIVSLHLPLTDETRHLIDAQRLARMKQGAILINAARGGLVDEAALLDALDRGHLFGAGLDVFEQEPPRPDHPLLHRDNVVATPHIASGTAAGKVRLWTTAINQALQVLRGERPPHLVNPEVWPAPIRR